MLDSKFTNRDTAFDSEKIYVPKDFDVFEPGVTLQIKLGENKDLKTISTFLDSFFTVPVNQNFKNIVYLESQD